MICVFLQSMLSKGQIKQFSSLKLKKFRQKYGQIVVEGEKSVQELLQSNLKVQFLLFESNANTKIISNIGPSVKVIENCGLDLKKISSLSTPSNIIAIAETYALELKKVDISKGYTLFLDEIRDPGNLGTIIRTAAWYGITQIALSEGCADVYNPKTIQSAMGSIWKVNFEYVEKISWLKAYKALGLPIYGAFLNGENIHVNQFAKSGLLILGNEGAGISSEAAQFVTNKITIPGSGMVESLNVASAAAILCDTIYRHRIGVKQK